MNDFWTYWYIHIPNFALAAVAYTLIGRFVLGLFVPENWDNYIWRFFRLITDPFVRIVRAITVNRRAKMTPHRRPILTPS